MGKSVFALLKKMGWIFVLCLLFLLAFFFFSILKVRYMSEGYKPGLSIPRDENLFTHVEFLAGHLGSRSVYEYEKLKKAEEYISKTIEGMGLTPFKQTFHFQGNEFSNLIVRMGNEREETVVIGAHYDTVLGTPGADDNASGVAILLEMCRLLKGSVFKKNLELVFFALEEPPLFRTPHMGSNVYIHRATQAEQKIKAMLSLEMLGYYDERKGSQRFPFPLMEAFFPDRGNFIAVVGNLHSRPLIRQVAQTLKKNQNLAVEYLAAPSFVPGIDFSDHLPFIRRGYMAAMITDTAFYRNPFYHTEKDKVETLNYAKMEELLSGLIAVAKELANS